MTAINPNEEYATCDLSCGEFEKDWTLSMRLFFKLANIVESISNITKRIKTAHKHKQAFAGYILDSVYQTLYQTDQKDITEKMLEALSMFDIRSDKPIEIESEKDSKLSVMNNILTRGLPTLAPVAIEKLFNKLYHISSISTTDSPSLYFNSNGTLNASDLFEALHIIDPRFCIDNYNGDMLQSDFERKFIRTISSNESTEYISQILEPQRPLSTLVKLPERNFSKDKSVDFSLQLPYTKDNSINRNGFIVEIDGTPYHTNIYNRLHDKKRTSLTNSSDWQTVRIKDLNNLAFIHEWEQDTSACNYLKNLNKNYHKKIEGKWADILQIVLSPFAVARIEKVLIDAVLSNNLSEKANVWNILIVERDVPCGYMAIKDFKSTYHYLSKLVDNKDLPKINVDVVSTKEFINSPLHLGKEVSLQISSKHYDICIDISMLIRDNIDALPLLADADVSYIVRSSHYKKQNRTIYCAKNITYKPLVEKTDRGEFKEIEEGKSSLTYFLQNIFRKKEFRTGQLPILSRSLSGRTTIGLLPTGGGKSLTYQLSAMLQPGVTLIVDPLISLMVDQQRGLHDIGIDSCSCINSTMDYQEKNQQLRKLQNGEIQFMLLSPERFMMEKFRESLSVMSKFNNIYFSYGVIDEVHCVSEWGHDFRPAYLHLGRNMMNFMHTKSGHKVPILGLTATASFDVLADVERELTLGDLISIDSNTVVRSEEDERKELTYKIIYVNGNLNILKQNSNLYILNISSFWDIRDRIAEAKKEKVNEILEEIPKDIEKLNEKNNTLAVAGLNTESFYDKNEKGLYPNAGIIFCPHAKGSLGVKSSKSHGGFEDYLSTHNNKLKIGTFIGTDKDANDQKAFNEEKLKAMKTFNENKLNVMVATKAFGMGIDKPNVRFTINITHPSSIESFVQEAGRAGRDKNNAISYLLYEPTEYICLTEDKIEVIKNAIGFSALPAWLWNHRNQYVLKDDFINFGICQNVPKDIVKKAYDSCVAHDFFENDDKNVELWFHNKSFKGIDKEKLILKELTRNILNAPLRNVDLLQTQLRKITGEQEACLKLDVAKAQLKLYLDESVNNLSCIVYLNGLLPQYTDNSDLCKSVTESLIGILQSMPNHQAWWLDMTAANQPKNTGIYHILTNTANGKYSYVIIKWDNYFQQAPTQYITEIDSAINKIAQKQGWAPATGQKWDEKTDFRDLIQLIADKSNDCRWIQYLADKSIYQPLIVVFCKRRDKYDTDKAIYRLCCVGIVDDVLIDYNAETYTLRIYKKNDNEYVDTMRHFFRKYYSNVQAEEHIEEMLKHEGNNVLDKCLSYLTEFIYNTLERKRYRAIDDMRLACQQGEEKGEDWLKNFIHLYFNSKYARDDYKINGKPYSLKNDVSGKNAQTDFKLVIKYIKAINIDNSGSQIENVKHLYGAVLLSLRTYVENGALHLLRTFCLVFLGIGKNVELRKEAHDSYVEGFVSIHEKCNVDVYPLMDQFNGILDKIKKDDYVKEDILDNGKAEVSLIIHQQWTDNFKNKYLKDWEQ